MDLLIVDTLGKDKICALVVLCWKKESYPQSQISFLMYTTFTSRGDRTLVPVKPFVTGLAPKTCRLGHSGFYVMAQRRMFSKTITESDSFLSMGADVQNLYFHLGMQADDDGFVSPRRVIRMVGAAEDSLKLLLVKGFVIPFESGVHVITAWRENNYIQSDRYKPTVHIDEMASMKLVGNLYTKCIPNVLVGEDRRGEDRRSATDVAKYEIVKDEPQKPTRARRKYPLVYSIFKEYGIKPQLIWNKNTVQQMSAENLLKEHGEEQIRKALEFYSETKDEPFCPQINSPWDLDTKWKKLSTFKNKHGN